MLAGTGDAGTGTNIGTAQPYENVYTNRNVGIGGITFTSTTNLLTLYNSDGVGGLDDDLEAGPNGFAGGNGNEFGGYGNLLILQTNDDTGAGNVDNPNDDRDGGTLIINSDLPLVEFAFSYIDLDAGNPTNGSTIIFRDTSDLMNIQSTTITFTSLETGGVLFGDNHANDIGLFVDGEIQGGITAASLGLTQFNQIEFVTAGSGGLAEFSVETLVVPVPEPSSSLLIALGALSFTLRRRR